MNKLILALLAAIIIPLTFAQEANAALYVEKSGASSTKPTNIELETKCYRNRFCLWDGGGVYSYGGCWMDVCSSRLNYYLPATGTCYNLPKKWNDQVRSLYNNTPLRIVVYEDGGCNSNDWQRRVDPGYGWDQISSFNNGSLLSNMSSFKAVKTPLENKNKRYLPN